MIRSGWGSALPRRLALVAVALLIPILAGCEADNDAPSLQFHYPTDTAGYPADAAGTSAVGNLAIRNVFVLGAPLGQSLQKGQSASLFLAVINGGAPDRLISISAPGSATSVSLPAGGVPVLAGHPVLLTGPAPQLVLLGLTRTLTSGSSVRLNLVFQKAGTMTLLVPVMPRAVQYQTFAPPQPTQTAVIPPSPTTTATPTPTATPTGHHAHASPSPTPST